jgi:hypothetical protein
MKAQTIKTALNVVILIIVTSACSLPKSQAPRNIEPPTQIPSTTASETPAAIAVPPVDTTTQHKIIPVNLPSDRSSHAGDYDSSKLAAKKIVAGGDRFTFGRFERPFNANTMDIYFSQLDIVDTYVYQDDTWIYGTITLNKPDAAKGFDGKYALEIDLDRDGKGDWLIIASGPSSTEWTVKGVQVYQDKNKDVGNISPMFTDKNTTDGDGYETLVFDQGTGGDADSAWVRISPNDPNTIEISVKRSVLSNPDKYLINMWAGTSSLNPALFDINDHFTQEQAGAADPGLEVYYPIKAVSELDNSCKMAVGFKPTGQEPGLCEIFIPKEVGQPAPPQPQIPIQPPCTGCSCIPC